ncbi:hypothetical protein P7C70_g173, partial [Phenoliferia sp. Uapishka_3]
MSAGSQSPISRPLATLPPTISLSPILLSATPIPSRTSRKPIFDLHSSSPESFSAADRTLLQSQLDRANLVKCVFRHGEEARIVSALELQDDESAWEDDLVEGETGEQEVTAVITCRSRQTVEKDGHWECKMIVNLDTDKGAVHSQDESQTAIANETFRIHDVDTEAAVPPLDVLSTTCATLVSTPSARSKLQACTDSMSSGQIPRLHPTSLPRLRKASTSKPLRVVTGFCPAPHSSNTARPVPIRTVTAPEAATAFGSASALSTLLARSPSPPPPVPHSTPVVASPPALPESPATNKTEENNLDLVNPFAKPAVVGERKKKRILVVPRAPPSSPAEHIETVSSARYGQKVPRIPPPRIPSANSASSESSAGSSSKNSATAFDFRASRHLPPAAHLTLPTKDGTIAKPTNPSSYPPSSRTVDHKNRSRNRSVMSATDPADLVLNFARNPLSIGRNNGRSMSVSSTESVSALREKNRSKARRQSRSPSGNGWDGDWETRKWQAQCWSKEELERGKMFEADEVTEEAIEEVYHFEPSVFASPRSNSANSLSASSCSSLLTRSPASPSSRHSSPRFSSTSPRIRPALADAFSSTGPPMDDYLSCPGVPMQRPSLYVTPPTASRSEMKAYQESKQMHTKVEKKVADDGEGGSKEPVVFGDATKSGEPDGARRWKFFPF